MQKFSDPPLDVHENCGGAVSRLLSAPALQFKGTGWYITDYARSGGAKSDKSEKKETKESKTDSKPADSKSDSGSGSTPSKSD
jgi:predicted nucleic acid-binding Zn ribbon protein